MAKLTIKKHDGNFLITSTDPHIQQVFFGWADGADNPEFYGIGDGGDVGVLHSYGVKTAGRRDEWFWILSDEKMRTLAMWIGVGFAKNYYDTRKEKADHRYVLERITKAVGA